MIFLSNFFFFFIETNYFFYSLFFFRLSLDLSFVSLMWNFLVDLAFLDEALEAFMFFLTRLFVLGNSRDFFFFSSFTSRSDMIEHSLDILAFCLVIRESSNSDFSRSNSSSSSENLLARIELDKSDTIIVLSNVSITLPFD